MPQDDISVTAAQCAIVKFLTREGVSPSEIHTRLKAQFQNECLSEAKVFILSKSYATGEKADCNN